MHLKRTVPIYGPDVLPEIDAVLISHLHYDHLDFSSLDQLGKDRRLIIPNGAAPLLQRHGFQNFQEVGEGDVVDVKGVKVRATFANHKRTRRPLGPEADCLGYVLQGEASIYFPGDTYLFPGMADICENLDVALLPVWGWGPDRGKLHLGPKEAAEALQMLKPRIAIPIHWGTYIPIGLDRFRPGFHYFPPLEFSYHAKTLAPQVEVRVLTPGDKITI
jgi:L-ascorbate metabolism protein UlaG (beta-lactamase superfamily)